MKLMNRRYKISANTLVDIAFILFFSNALVRIIINRLLGTGSFSKALAVLVIYVPLLLACIANPKKYIKQDFVVLYVFIILFFTFSWLVHPEYSYYYARPDYGVWNYVLLPYRGLYAYLFVRLMDRPERFTRNYRIAGWLMFLYFAYQLVLYLRRGYWLGVAGSNGQAHMSYSVSFGYDVLPFALFFLYQALKQRKASDWVAAVLAVAMVLAGGSRGAMLFVGVFVVLYCLIEVKNSRHKIGIIFIIGVCFALLYALYDTILLFISGLVSRMGFSSRFITSLLSGNISNDSGRSKIWAAAIQMIRDNPWGYGAMGSQHVISKYIYAGYPHSLILDMLIDFGVIFGTIILIFLFYNAFSMLLSEKKKRWLPVFLPFFSTACCLFLSLTYWGLPAFWACIGIGVNCLIENRGNRIVDTESKKIMR